jgi:hypothetical protein
MLLRGLIGCLEVTWLFHTAKVFFVRLVLNRVLAKRSISIFQGQVQPLDVVDNSLSLLRIYVELDFSSLDAQERVLHSVDPRTCPVFTFTQPPPARSHVVFSLDSCSHWDTRHQRQGRTEHFPCGPSSGGSPYCHGWGTLAIALGHQVATSLARLHERYSQ